MSRTLLYRTNYPPISVSSVTKGSSSTPSSITVTGISNNVGAIQIPIAYNSGAASVTDSNGNLYLGTTMYGGAGILTRTLYCFNPIVTSTMTFYINAGSYSAAVMIVQGSTSPAIDSVNGNGTQGSSINSGIVSPSISGELIIAAAATGTVSTGTPPAIGGFTLVNVPFSSGNWQGLVLYYQVQPSAAPISVNFTGSNITYYAATIVARRN